MSKNLTPQKRISGLYAISDENLMRPKRFKSMLRDALEGGASIVQYRNKSKHHELRWQQAQSVVDLCKMYNAISIINDDIELAKVVNADGVHIGETDDSIQEARERLGTNKIIGVSCYNDIELALNAEKNGADYVAFGTMFASTTKPNNRLAGIECVSSAKLKTKLPVVAIGGINPSNAVKVVQAGADSIAVVSALFAQDDIKSTAKAFSALYNT